MEDHSEIVEIMLQKSAGAKNSLGDEWSDGWCWDAAQEILRLEGRIYELERNAGSEGSE